ncbi:hypothetical protein ACQJBY_060256 [Aegilops geniculata]
MWAGSAVEGDLLVGAAGARGLRQFRARQEHLVGSRVLRLQRTQQRKLNAYKDRGPLHWMHDDDDPPSSTSSWKSRCEFLLGFLLRLSLPSTLSAPKPLTPSWLFLYFLFVLFLPMHFS